MKKQWIIGLAALVGLSLGCGKSEKTYNTPEGQVKVKEKSGEVTYEATTKEGKFTLAAGDKGVALPANFPADVPILKGATVKAAMTQGGQMVIHLHAAGSIADATTFYNDALKSQGWEIETTMNMGGTAMVSAKKSGRQCNVVASKDGDGTLVQVMVSQEGS